MFKSLKFFSVVFLLCSFFMVSSNVANAEGFWDSFDIQLWGEENDKNGSEFSNTIEADKQSASKLTDVLKSKISGLNFIQTGGDMSEKIGTGVPTSGKVADSLLGYLTIVSILSAVIVSYTSGGKGMVEPIAMTITTFVVITLMLINYQGIFVTGLANLFKAMATQLSISGGGSIEDLFINAIGDLFMMCVGIFAKIGLNFGGFSFMRWLEALLVMIPLAYAAFLALKAAFTTFIIYFMGDLLAGIALAVGPLFLALGVYEPTKGYLGSWLGFLLSSLFIKVVAIVVIAIAGTAVLNILSVPTADDTSFVGGSIFVDAFVTIIFLQVFIEAINMVPQIANTLFGGGVRFSSKGVDASSSMGKGASAAGTGGAAAGRGAMAAGKAAINKIDSLAPKAYA